MLISSGRVAARERFSLSGATARLQKPLRHSVSLSKSLRRIGLSGLAALLVGITSSANAAYVQRYSTTTRGAITFVGNSLGLSRAAGNGGLTAPGTSDSIGALSTTNTALQVGTYPAGTTADWHLDGSSAILTIPAGSAIIHAELIWGGSEVGGADDVTASIDTPVTFAMPGGTTTTVGPNAAASQVGGGRYIRAADVTDLVVAAGTGTYTVSGVPATRGNTDTDNAAGWTLAVVYSNSTLAVRNMTIFVGAEIGGAAAAGVTGFCTPSSGTLNGRVLVTAIEGDASRTGDTFLFGSTTTLTNANRLSGTNNPIGNFFASQINGDTGALVTTGTFGTRNHNAATGTNISGGRQGWDITNVDGSTQLVVNQTQAYAQGTTTGDQYTIAGLGLQIDVFAPSFPVTVKQVDRTSTYVGDTITYTVTLNNNGGSTANNIVFNDPVPANTSFVAGSFKIDGVTQAGVLSPVGVAMGSIANGAQKVVTFQVHVDSLPASHEITNSANWTYNYTACSSTLPGSVTTNEVSTPIPVADLSITKTDGSATATLGGPISYTIVASNAGTATATGAIVSDTIPAAILGATWTAAYAGGASGPASGSGNINASVNLPTGGTATFTVTGTVDPAATGTLANTAAIAAPVGITDPNTGNNNATDTDTLSAQANLGITKTDGATNATPGAPITYTIVASNAGPSTATGATVADTIPGNITGATWTVAYAGGASGPASGSGNINASVNLPSGGTATFTVTGTISASATGTLSNTATVTVPAGVTDPTPGNNSATDSDTLNPSANLSVSKTDGSTTYTPGASITYTIVAGNAGPSSANGATVSDTIPASITGATWTVAYAGGASGPASGSGNINASVNLPVGGTATFTVTGTVGAGTTGSLSNTATIAVPAGTTDPTPGNNSATDLDTANPQANLGITKTDGATSATPGSPISYTIVASNAGPSTATGATVTDTIPASITGAAWTAVYAGGASGPASGSGNINASVNLPVGGTATFTVTGTISATATGTLANTATIAAPAGTTDPTPGNNSATDSDTLNPSADLAITKTDGAASATPGSPITYTIVASNAGPSTATGATVSDTIPANITGATWTAAYAGGASGPASGSGNIAASVTLPSGGTATFTVTGTISPTATGSLANTATIAAPAGVTDPTPGNNSATDTDTLNPSANLSISKTDGSATYTPGASITYTIVAGNTGPSAATGATVSDTVPANITGATWTVVYAGGASGPASGSGNIAANVDLPVGGSATFTLTGTVSAAATGTLANSATIAVPAGTTDPTPGNNSDTDSDSANPQANLGIAKTDGATSATPGSPITYTIVASNAGPSNVTGATVADTIPAGITGATWTCVGAGGGTCPAGGSGNISASVNLPVGGTATFTVTGTISASATGTLANTATIAAPAGVTDPTPANNSSTDSDTLNPSANLGITKTDGATSATPGSPISYTIVASNAGPSTATGATVTDTIPASITGAAWTAVYAGGASGPASGSGNINASVNLPVGGTATFTVTGTISATATGTLANTAAIAAPAGTTDPTPGNNSATDTDTLNPSANLAITKTDGATSATPGNAITYTIVASNAGPSTATGATVTDTMPASITGATWTVAYAGGASGPASGSGNIAASVTLPSGGTATFTVTGTISASATGTLANTATIAAPAGVTDPTPGNNSATDSDTLNASADIRTVKTGPAAVGYGGALGYSVVVTNLGPSDANGTTFSDVVPASITGVSANCNTPTGGAACGAVNLAGNTVTSTITTLPSGASVTFTIAGTAPTSGASVTNSATANPPAGTTDPSTGNNTGSATTNLLQPQLTVTKAATPTPFIVGQPASYTITVSNGGAGPTAGNITIADTLPAGITLASASGTNWSCSGTGTLSCTYTGTIAAGGSTTLTLDVNVGAGAVNGNNSATASGGGDPTCPAQSRCTGTTTVPVNPSADIAISKSVDNPTPNVGEAVTFTVTATNNGPNAATGVAVNDALPSGLVFVSATPSQGTYDNNTGVWAIGAIGNGASVTLDIVATVLTPGAITNTATKSAGDQFDPNAGNNAGSASLNAQPSADLQVSKTVNTATPNLGTNVTYTITVVNAGPNDATNVSVDDLLPAGLVFVSATPSQGVYDDGVGLWTIGSVAAGDTVTLQIVATVTLPGDITNTATVDADEHDPNTTNNTGGVTLNGQSADIQVLKGVDNANPVRGDTVTFTITATNNGPSAATGVVISDLLPAGLSFVSATPSVGTYDNLTGRWTIGGLAASGAGATATLTVVADVDTDSGFTNTASLTAIDQTDPNPANNSASVVVTPIASADLSITKTDGSASATPGAPVTYTIVASNAGPSPANGATIIDTLPAQISGASWTCVGAGGASCAFASGVGDINTLADIPAGGSVTFSVTGTIAANASGTLANTATVAPPAGTSDPDNGNNSATDSDTLNASANLAISKTDGSGTATPGSPITYTIVASNAGPSDANGVTVTDAIPASITGASWTCVATGAAACTSPSGSGSINTTVDLPAGDSVTFTVTGTIAPTATGTLANTATIVPPVGTTDPDPNDDTSTDSDGLTPQADLAISKTDGATSATPGSPITYTIVASNAGPSTATNATVTDAVPAAILGATWTCVGAGGATCPASGSGNINASVTIPSGASVTFTVTGTVSAAATGTLANTASVAAPAGTTDPNGSNNSATDSDTLAASANLAISKTDGAASATPGSPITYTIVATNAGPSNAVGATVADTIPASIAGATWTCVGAGGATCPASGSGNINATVNVPVGGSVTFTVSGTISSTATGTLANTATIAPPAGTTDPTPGDNSATDSDTLTPSANLAISKTDGSASATPGSPISYTIVASNAGPSTATAAVVADTIPATITGATWTAAYAGGASGPASGSGNINATVNIPVGGTATFTVSGTVSASATGSLSNTATVTPPAGTTDPTPGDNSATDTDTLTPQGDLSISKTDGSANATPGASITYTIVAGNSGPSNVTGAIVADAIPASITGATWTCVGAGGGTCPAGGSGNINATVNLPVGGTATFTVSGTVSASATGTLANTATIAPPAGTTDPTPGNNSATDSDTLTPSANLAISKTDGSASATPGSPISYTIVASNAGPSTATAAVVADTIPATITGATWTAAYAGGASGPASGSGNINATVNIPVGGTATFTVSGTVSASATGSLSNTATVTPPAGTTDPTPGDNSATDTDTLNPNADLAISKTDGAASATPGSPISYTIVASNAGPSNATGATVADTVPATITGATWTAVYAGGASGPASGSGNIAATVNIPVGGTATFTLAGTVSASATGSLANTATIAAPAGTTDPTPGNNGATDTDTLNPQADLMVSKTDGSATATPGNTVTYTIVASNAGPSNATGATVADTIPATITGATWTCAGTGGATCPATGSGNINATVNIPVGGNATFTVTGTLSATATGTLSNTATVAAPAGTTDPTPGNNSATDTDTLSPNADLAISKTDGSASATPGSPITYTIVASNAGPSAVTGATVADTIPATITGATWTCVGAGGGTCPASGSGPIAATVNLPVGGTATFTLSGTVSASATGTLTNTATISAPAGTTDPTPGNNSATDSDTLSGSADIEAHKTGPASVTAGAAIAYSVVVTNHGPSDANGTTFSDAVPAGITGITASCGTPTGGAVCGTVNVAGNSVTSTVTTLPSGASVTFTIGGTAPADPGSLGNTASAQPPAGITDPVPVNNSSSVSTTVDASADVAIAKTGPSTVASGAPISYTLVVSNAGPSAADGTTYSDAVPAAITGVTASCGSPSGGATCAAPTIAGNTVSGSVPTLPAGGSVTITISGTAPFGAQSFTNTATVTGPVGVPDPNGANNSSSVTTSIGAAADIALTKTVDNTAPNVGQTVTFTITASNAGPNDASGVAVTDSLPFGFGFVSATPSVGTYVPATGLWTIGALANGDSATLLIVASIDVPGALTNTVAVSASDQPDPNTSNNSAGASVNAGASADIAVAKTVDDATPNVGATITYTITANNGGPNDATGVEVTDNLPAGTTFVSATPSQGSYAGGVWSVGALANGASATLAISATVDAAGSIVNTATITHEDQFDPVGSNNQAGTTINGQQADLGVTKTVDDAAPDVGDSVTFTVTVHNNGPSDATGVALSDALPAGLVFVSATPSQGTYDNLAGVWTVGTLTAAGSSSSATLTIVADVAMAGAMTNTASVSASDQPDPNGANNSASASLNGNPLADLVVAKTGPATVTPGDDIAYTIVVTNDGPSDATNVVIADPTPAGLVFAGNAGACTTTYPCTLASLASGASATITTTYTVPADYAGANPIVNTASATATEPDPDTANNQSSASTGVGPGNADLSIVKTGPSAVASGGAVAYTLLVTNNGPSPANGASYSDVVPAGITAIVAACGGEAGGAACGTQPVVSGNTVSGTIGNLPSGGSVLVTIDGVAPTGPVALSNTATIDPPAGVNDPNPADNSSTVVTNVSPASADLAIVKSGPANAVAGGSVTYTLSVTNNGPDVATATQITDPTPAGLTFVSASIPCAGGFPCVLGDLAPGASTIVSVTYTVGAGVTGSVTNTATVGSTTPDPDSANNTSSATTPVVPVATSADLVLAKTGPATATPGENVTYALQVQNAGPDTAVNVVLADPTPANLTFVSASAPCASGFPCNLGSIASGAGTIVTVTYAVSPTATGAVTNSASVSSTTPDPDLGNNASSVTTPLVVAVTSANLAITKSGPATAMPGDTIAYTVVVGNAGPDAAANVVVQDATPPGLVFVGNSGACTTPYPCALGTLANGASATITSTYLVPTSYAGANPIVNLAGVVSATPDPDGTDNVATASTQVVTPALSADLRIAKSGPARAAAGTVVTYTLVVSNEGPDAVADAVLTDPTPAGLVFVSASAPCSGGFPCTLPALASGASTTLTVTYLVQPAFTGNITNVASVASSTVPDPTPNNNASTATTVVAGAPVAANQVPVDSRWMLLLMSALLLVVGSAAARRRR